jgi:hypothetical protein
LQHYRPEVVDVLLRDADLEQILDDALLIRAAVGLAEYGLFD